MQSLQNDLSQLRVFSRSNNNTEPSAERHSDAVCHALVCAGSQTHLHHEKHWPGGTGIPVLHQPCRLHTKVVSPVDVNETLQSTWQLQSVPASEAEHGEVLHFVLRISPQINLFLGGVAATQLAIIALAIA